jgi:hypothetical protein
VPSFAISLERFLELGVCGPRRHIQSQVDGQLPIITYKKKMKKYLLISLLSTASVLGVAPVPLAGAVEVTAENPDSANLAGYNWYNLGECVGAALEFSFNQRVSQQMDDQYKRIYDAMVKAGVSDATLAAFKEWYRVLQSLPWDKDWQQWSKEQQNAWINGGSSWYKGVRTDAGNKPESLFFYWLGRHTIKVSYAVPYYQSQGWAQDVTDAVASAADDFLSFSTDDVYKTVFSTLSPDIQKLMTFIASFDRKLKLPANPLDPSDQITADEIAKIIEAAKQLRAAAQGNKLLSI